LIIVLLVLYMKRDLVMEYIPGKGGEVKKEKKEKKAVQSDNELTNIIVELMDTGVSDMRIKGKLKEYGLTAEEADKLIIKAREEK